MKNSVLVFGGTGFLGESIIEKLIKYKYRPIVLLRDKKRIKKEWEDKCDFIVGDMQNIIEKIDLIKALNPIATIYSIGLLKEEGGKTFLDFHFNWAKVALNASKICKVKKFIYISANGVKAGGTRYQKTKFQFEEYLKSNFENYTILRPSLIIERSSKYSFLNVLDLLTRFIIVPIFKGGNYGLAPVFRGDVSEIIAKSIYNEKAINTVYCICGPRKYSFKELIRLFAKSKNRKVIFIDVPFFIIKPIVRILQKFTWFPVTADQLTMLFEGNTCSENKVWLDLQVEPTDIASFF